MPTTGSYGAATNDKNTPFIVLAVVYRPSTTEGSLGEVWVNGGARLPAALDDDNHVAFVRWVRSCRGCMHALAFVTPGCVVVGQIERPADELVHFAGYSRWWKKWTSSSTYAPGPTWYSKDPADVFVALAGHVVLLHLPGRLRCGRCASDLLIARVHCTCPSPTSQRLCQPRLAGMPLKCSSSKSGCTTAPTCPLLCCVYVCVCVWVWLWVWLCGCVWVWMDVGVDGCPSPCRSSPYRRLCVAQLASGRPAVIMGPKHGAGFVHLRPNRCTALP